MSSRTYAAGLVVIGALVALLRAPGAVGQVTTGTAPPPFDLKDSAAIEEGARLFRANCTHYCHGAEGRVGRGPALRGRHLDPAFVYQRIANGAPPMPAFGSNLRPEQIWDLVAYIGSLEGAKD